MSRPCRPQALAEQVRAREEDARNVSLNVVLKTTRMVISLKRNPAVTKCFVTGASQHPRPESTKVSSSTRDACLISSNVNFPAIMNFQVGLQRPRQCPSHHIDSLGEQVITGVKAASKDPTTGYGDSMRKSLFVIRRLTSCHRGSGLEIGVLILDPNMVTYPPMTRAVTPSACEVTLSSRLPCTLAIPVLTRSKRRCKN